MKIGCFALIEPFTTLEHQFSLIRGMGFDYADVTDSHDGASLGSEFGFAATASLDGHPSHVRKMAEDHQLTLSAVCAHANLLDPTSPATYGTTQIIKAVKLAHFLGIKQVITTEGEPHTAFGRALTHEQRLFVITEKLQEPIRWAKELDIELLLEPHGQVTDDLDATQELLDRLGEPDTVGLNLDTGNCWLGGGDPLEYTRRFADRIRHVHWKDMPGSMEGQRGKVFGCGMATIALGEGVVEVEKIARQLVAGGFDGPTTLEIAGEEAVKASADALRQWSGSD